MLPRINEDVNEEWAHDKTRYHVDGLVRRRLDKPFVRKAGKLVEASWDEAFDAIAAVARPARASRRSPATCSTAETMYAAKALREGLGSDLLEGRQTGMAYDVTEPRRGGVQHHRSPSIENADAILLVGTNLRWEAPLINTRVRKAIKKGAKVFAIGPETDLTYKRRMAGQRPGAARQAAGRCRRGVRRGQAPVLIVGPGALKDGRRALRVWPWLGRSRTGWNGFNVVHIRRGADGRADARLCAEGRHRRHRSRLRRSWPSSWAPTRSTSPSFAKTASRSIIGHHGDKGAHHADVDPAGRDLYREAGHLCEPRGPRPAGRPRGVRPRATPARTGRSCARSSDMLGHTLPFDSFEAAARRDARAKCPRWAERAWADYDWAPPKLAAERDGPGRLSDHRFLPHQRHLPCHRRRCSAARPN